jgi:hypothetical protein
VSGHPLGGERTNERVSLFEYLSIAYSLVFSFAAIRLVAGLPHVVASTQRYYVHVSHVFLVLFATVALFWAFWSFRDLQWNLFRFISLLAGPGMVYFLACTLIPDEPSSVDSWHAYFYSVRRQYFGGFCLWSVLQVMNTTIVLKIPLLHPIRVVQLLIFAMGVAGSITDNPEIQRIIAIGGWVLAAIASFVLFLPGPLAA